MAKTTKPALNPDRIRAEQIADALEAHMVRQWGTARPTDPFIRYARAISRDQGERWTVSVDYDPSPFTQWMIDYDLDTAAAMLRHVEAGGELRKARFEATDALVA